jgi:hypothetical protein
MSLSTELTTKAAELFSYRADRGQLDNLRLSQRLIDFNELTADIQGIVNVRNAFDGLIAEAAAQGDAAKARYLAAIGSMV